MGSRHSASANRDAARQLRGQKAGPVRTPQRRHTPKSCAIPAPRPPCPQRAEHRRDTCKEAALEHQPPVPPGPKRHPAFVREGGRRHFLVCLPFLFEGKGFPGGSVDKGSACKAGDLGSIPGLGRSPRGGDGYPLQYSCLENPLHRGAWRAASMGSQRVDTTGATEHTHTLKKGLIFHVILAPKPLPRA